MNKWHYLLSTLPHDPIILEAGTHTGYHTQKIASTWPQGHIHAFEPVPEIYHELQKRIANFNNITTYNLALSNSNGIASCFISGGASTSCSSLLRPQKCLIERPDITFEKTISVPTTTLDSWAQYYSIKQIDFLWLDMQGMELSVLTHGKHIIATTKVIYTEINTTERYTHNTYAHEMHTFLTNNGFHLIHVYLTHISWGNALYSRI